MGLSGSVKKMVVEGVCLSMGIPPEVADKASKQIVKQHEQRQEARKEEKPELKTAMDFENEKQSNAPRLVHTRTGK